jgi:hypothetical protein
MMVSMPTTTASLHESHDLAKTYEIIEGPIYMEPGDKLTVAASAANAIIVTAYGRIL